MLVETNLKNASRLFWLNVTGYVVLALALGQLGLMPEMALVPAWLVNLAVAYFIGRAAAAQGRSHQLFGFGAALGPPVALFALMRLRNHAVWAAAEERYR